MEQYAIIMNDGRQVVTTGVDLKNVAAVYNQRQSIAAVIGRKSMTKGLVAAVAKLKALDKTSESNVMVQVGQTILYTTAEPEKFLDTLTNEVNNKEFAMANDDILVSRAFYSHAEVIEIINEKEVEMQV